MLKKILKKLFKIGGIVFLVIFFVLAVYLFLFARVGTISDEFYNSLPEMTAEECIKVEGSVESPQIRPGFLGSSRMEDVCGGRESYLGNVVGYLCDCVCCK